MAWLLPHNELGRPRSDSQAGQYDSTTLGYKRVLEAPRTSWTPLGSSSPLPTRARRSILPALRLASHESFTVGFVGSFGSKHHVGMRRGCYRAVVHGNYVEPHD